MVFLLFNAWKTVQVCLFFHENANVTMLFDLLIIKHCTHILYRKTENITQKFNWTPIYKKDISSPAG